jgi:adenylate cyclase
MATEIERKFLVDPLVWDSFKNEKEQFINKEYITQGYLNKEPDRTVRIRYVRSKEGSISYITVKGRTEGISRKEFEYKIPSEDAFNMLPLCVGVIQKIRYNYFSLDGKVWSIDEFGGKNDGLVIAEIELSDETDNPQIPEFIKEEVSHDPKYFNSNLSGDEPFEFDTLTDYQISFYKLDVREPAQEKLWTEFGH